MTERGDAAVARVREMTGGGAEHVIEAVGAAPSFEAAIDIARPGGTVGHVGVPAQPINLLRVHTQNIRLIGGVAPVRGYIPELMDDILAGKLDPSPVLDTTIGLEEVPEGYAAMDERTGAQGAGADRGRVGLRAVRRSPRPTRGPRARRSRRPRPRTGAAHRRPRRPRPSRRPGTSPRSRASRPCQGTRGRSTRR